MKTINQMLVGLGVLLFLGLTQARVGYAADPGVLLLSSNQAQAAGRYDDAILGYQELLDSGVRSAAIHYNLGIAHFKNSQLGRAIFHFNQAARLDPRDGDVRFNLDYARKKAVDKIEDHRPLWNVYFSRYLPINTKEALCLALMGVVFAVLFCTIHIYYKNDIIRWLWRLFLALAALSFLAYLGRLFVDEKMGVITAQVADVYSGQGENNVHLFTLHEGAEFSLEDTAQNGWLRIRLKDGKRGWVATTDAISESAVVKDSIR